MDDIVIPDENNLKEKIAKIESAGTDKLHVVADFDRTLTKATTKDGKINTSYAHLREGDYLSKEYHEKDKELFNIYYPLETSHDLSKEERYQKMVEWWDKHYELFIRSDMRKEIIDKIVVDKPLNFREGTEDVFKILAKNNIPFLIFSAGMGDFIKGTLERLNLLTRNTHILSNFFKFDEYGKAIDYSRPLIHSFNKNEQQIANHSYDAEIKTRKNVILLGDSLGDVGMAAGMDHDTIIKIGFLNKDMEKNLEKYKKAYDVIILNDGTMDYVVNLLLLLA